MSNNINSTKYMLSGLSSKQTLNTDEQVKDTENTGKFKIPQTKPASEMKQILKDCLIRKEGPNLTPSS